MCREKNGLGIRNQQEKSYQNDELFFLGFWKFLKNAGQCNKSGALWTSIYLKGCTGDITNDNNITNFVLVQYQSILGEQVLHVFIIRKKITLLFLKKKNVFPFNTYSSVVQGLIRCGIWTKVEVFLLNSENI